MNIISKSPRTHHGADIDWEVLRLMLLPERHGGLGRLRVVLVQLTAADSQLRRPLRVGPPRPGPGHVTWQVVLLGQVEAVLL